MKVDAARLWLLKARYRVAPTRRPSIQFASFRRPAGHLRRQPRDRGVTNPPFRTFLVPIFQVDPGSTGVSVTDVLAFLVDAEVQDTDVAHQRRVTLLRLCSTSSLPTSSASASRQLTRPSSSLRASAKTSATAETRPRRRSPADAASRADRREPTSPGTAARPRRSRRLRRSPSRAGSRCPSRASARSAPRRSRRWSGRASRDRGSFPSCSRCRA